MPDQPNILLLMTDQQTLPCVEFVTEFVTELAEFPAKTRIIARFYL